MIRQLAQMKDGRDDAAIIMQERDGARQGREDGRRVSDGLWSM